MISNGQMLLLSYEYLNSIVCSGNSFMHRHRNWGISRKRVGEEDGRGVDEGETRLFSFHCCNICIHCLHKVVSWKGQLNLFAFIIYRNDKTICNSLYLHTNMCGRYEC